MSCHNGRRAASGHLVQPPHVTSASLDQRLLALGGGGQVHLEELRQGAGKECSLATIWQSQVKGWRCSRSRSGVVSHRGRIVCHNGAAPSIICSTHVQQTACNKKRLPPAASACLDALACEAVRPRVVAGGNAHHLGDTLIQCLQCRGSQRGMLRSSPQRSAAAGSDHKAPACPGNAGQAQEEELAHATLPSASSGQSVASSSFRERLPA